MAHRKDSHDRDRLSTETGSARFRWTTPEQPSTAVVEALATVMDRDPTELPTLYDTIDPDALDALTAAAGAPDGITVSFEYEHYAVTVHSNRRIDVEALPDGDH